MGHPHLTYIFKNKTKTSTHSLLSKHDLENIILLRLVTFIKKKYIETKGR